MVHKKAVRNESYYYYKTKGRERREGDSLIFCQGHPLLRLLHTHIPSVNQLPSRDLLPLAFLPSVTHLTILTSGNQVSSKGAAGVSPRVATPWPWRRAAGNSREKPCQAPSRDAIKPAAAESQWQEHPDGFQKELLGPGGHLVGLLSQSWAIGWSMMPGWEADVPPSQQDLNPTSKPPMTWGPVLLWSLFPQTHVSSRIKQHPVPKRGKPCEL